MALSGRSISKVATGLAACAALLCAQTLAPAASPRGDERIGITDVAPADSFVVATVPDWPRAKAAMLRSEAGKLWNEPQVRSFLLAMAKEELSENDGSGGLWGWLADNVDADDLREPTGPVGLALFPAMVPDRDNQGKTVNRIQAIMIAEFGDDAGQVMDTIEDALQRLEREGRVELDDDDHDGVDIRVVKVVEEPEDPEMAELRRQWDIQPDRTFDAFNTLMLARAGGRIVASTSRDALERALDRIDGRRLESVGESRAYRAALAQHPADQHALIVGLATEYVRTSINEGMGASMRMMPLPISSGPVLEALGLGSVDAVGMGLRFDTDAASVEQSFGVLAPQKKGLLTLLDSSIARFDPPPFAPADAVGVWSVALRFDRLSDLIRSILRSMPPEFQQQALAGFDQVAAPILASFGSEMHVIRTLDRPLGPDSSSTVVAIRLKDPLTLANALNGFAGMLQMTPRVFEGNQLFESEEGGAPSIGIGFDHVFIGSTVAVENAMRLASRPDTPRLSAAPRFTRAVAPLEGNGAVYQYDNFAESLAWTYWSTENAERIFEAQLEGWGLDAETREEYLADFREDRSEWQKNLPPMRLILDHVGDSIFEMRSTSDGFRGRSLILRPAPR